MGPSVAELVLAFRGHSEVYDRRAEGAPTGELAYFKHALRSLVDRYAATPAREFGPLRLKAVRQAMHEAGLSRRLINPECIGSSKSSPGGPRTSLLPADVGGPNLTDRRIAYAFRYRTRTVESIHRRLVEDGFREAMDGKTREMPPSDKLLDGEQVTRIIATRLGSPSAG